MSRTTCLGTARRGIFHSVAGLEAAIGIYIDGWNDRAHPFTWTKSAYEIISRAKPSSHRKKTYSTRHEVPLAPLPPLAGFR